MRTIVRVICLLAFGANAKWHLYLLLLRLKNNFSYSLKHMKNSLQILYNLSTAYYEVLIFAKVI